MDILEDKTGLLSAKGENMKIKITDEFLELYKDGATFDKEHFNTNDDKNDLEVFVPFTGYYKIKVDCTNPQIAMAEVLKMNELVGFESLTNIDKVIEDIEEDETYFILPDDLMSK